MERLKQIAAATHTTPSEVARRLLEEGTREERG
jgi:hypothetical protein